MSDHTNTGDYEPNPCENYEPPKSVGYYDIGGVYLSIQKKPNRFQQWCVKKFFGWEWKEF